MARETARRIKIAGVNQKRPFLVSHIRRLFELWGGLSANLHQLMKLTADFTLCYVSFFRFDDLVAVQWQSIKFVGEWHMELLIPDSKTDQYWLGKTVFVARLGGPFCLVSLVRRLLEAGQYRLHGNDPLTRSTVIWPPAQHIRSSAPCYSTVNAWFKEAASILGLDPKFYGTHSGRRGGATGTAAHDVPDGLFKGHGRWRTKRAKDMYVREKLQDRLSVTRNLSLPGGCPHCPTSNVRARSLLSLELFVSHTTPQVRYPYAPLFSCFPFLSDAQSQHLYNYPYSVRLLSCFCVL
jgi:hypothetical protein